MGGFGNIFFEIWCPTLWLWCNLTMSLTRMRHNNTSIAESNLLWPICEKMLILYLFPGLKRNKLANLLIIFKHYYVTCANLDNFPYLYCPLRNIKFPRGGVNIPLPDTSAINLHDLNLSHQHTFQVSVSVN